MNLMLGQWCWSCHHCHVVRVNRCATPWPLAISDLHSRSKGSPVGRWHPPEPCWTRRCEGNPAVFSKLQLAFCLRRYPPSDAEHPVLVLQDPGVQHGQTEISVLIWSVKFLTWSLLIQRGTLDQEDLDMHESGCRIQPTQPHMGPGDFWVTCIVAL